MTRAKTDCFAYKPGQQKPPRRKAECTALDKLYCRELVAADYGAPTTRKRWYAIFRRDGREIVWPVPTYFKDREPRWKACGDYIDWSD